MDRDPPTRRLSVSVKHSRPVVALAVESILGILSRGWQRSAIELRSRMKPGFGAIEMRCTMDRSLETTSVVSLGKKSRMNVDRYGWFGNGLLAVLLGRMESRGAGFPARFAVMSAHTFMTTRPKISLTVEDYKLLPDEGPRYELIEGELIMAPAPNRFHQDISRNLEYLMVDYLRRHPIGVVYDAPFDVYLDETNVFQPDLVFISKARRSILTDAGAQGAPDLVVEVLSPSTRKVDETDKKGVFARTGVNEYWLIDPEEKAIRIYALGQDVETPVATHAGADKFERPLLPGLMFELEQIFRQPF